MFFVAQYKTDVRLLFINTDNTGMGVRRYFSRERQSRHFACPFQAVDDTMQMDVYITLYPFYTTMNMTHVATAAQKMRFFGRSVSYPTT